ncbi:MAG: LamG domain-containing protein [Planctomycetota bacterium]|nr:LamG domain-containing protein [Planctomycetota bacterium]
MPAQHRIPATPEAFPGLVAFWDFQEPAGGPRRSKVPHGYALQERNGPIARVETPGNPFGPYAAKLHEGQWFNLPRAECPALDLHGPQAQLTVVAWLARSKKTLPHCEFVAGQWNETNKGRQYGLFLNLKLWGTSHCVCAHVSNVGGPTPGYKYCMDAAIGATPVPFDEWSCVAMSYDGVAARAYLNGELDAREGLNPYSYAGGLHDGGAGGSDFTVGGVDRSGEMGNWFAGLLGGLGVWRRALSPAELRALNDPRAAAP